MRFLDILGLLVTFAIVGYVGYYSSKKVKSSNDFMLAGESLGKVQAGLSMAATEFGGSSLIGAMAFCYGVGISGVWWDWAAVPAMLLLGIFFAEKIKLPSIVTVTDFLEKRYNKPTKIIASIMHLLAITTQLSTQFMVGAVALYGIAGIHQNIGLAFTVIFIMLYTVGGGLIAVVNTDVVQFVLICLSLLISLPVALIHAGGFTGLTNALPSSFFQINMIGYPKILSWCLFCFFTYATNQHYLQRVFAAKNKSTAKFAYTFTGISYIFYGAIVGILGICIAAIMPNLKDPNLGYALLIKNFTPNGLAGIILGGIFAASMSTASSMLLAASTLFVNDICMPFFKKNTDDRTILKAIRWVTIIVCVFSACIALFMNNIVNIMYLGGLFYSTAVFFPLVIGLFWKKATGTAAIVSIVSTVIMGLVSEFFLAGKVHGFWGLPSNIIGAITSIVVLIIVSLLTTKSSRREN